jgi:hypothetical protein
VLGVAALVHQVLWRNVLRADLHELRRVLVILAEVGAQAALTVVNLQHVGPPVCLLAELLRDGLETPRIRRSIQYANHVARRQRKTQNSIK